MLPQIMPVAGLVDVDIFIKDMLYDKELYKQRHKIEIMFGRLKDWRGIATRYDRCAHTFMSSICIAAIVTFYL